MSYTCTLSYTYIVMVYWYKYVLLKKKSLLIYYFLTGFWDNLHQLPSKLKECKAKYINHIIGKFNIFPLISLTDIQYPWTNSDTEKHLSVGHHIALNTDENKNDNFEGLELHSY